MFQPLQPRPRRSRLPEAQMRRSQPILQGPVRHARTLHGPPDRCLHKSPSLLAAQWLRGHPSRPGYSVRFFHSEESRVQQEGGIEAPDPRQPRDGRKKCLLLRSWGPGVGEFWGVW